LGTSKNSPGFGECFRPTSGCHASSQIGPSDVRGIADGVRPTQRRAVENTATSSKTSRWQVVFEHAAGRSMRPEDHISVYLKLAPSTQVRQWPARARPHNQRPAAFFEVGHDIQPGKPATHHKGLGIVSARTSSGRATSRQPASLPLGPRHTRARSAFPAKSPTVGFHWPSVMRKRGIVMRRSFDIYASDVAYVIHAPSKRQSARPGKEPNCPSQRHWNRLSVTTRRRSWPHSLLKLLYDGIETDRR